MPIHTRLHLANYELQRFLHKVVIMFLQCCTISQARTVDELTDDSLFVCTAQHHRSGWCNSQVAHTGHCACRHIVDPGDAAHWRTFEFTTSPSFTVSSATSHCIRMGRRKSRYQTRSEPRYLMKQSTVP